MYRAMFSFDGTWFDQEALFALGGSTVLLVICVIGSTQLPKKAAAWLEEKLGANAFAWLSYSVIGLTLLASMAFLVADSYNPFLYFRF